MSKATPQEAKDGRANALRTHLASLAYLREEAKRDGLEALAKIISEALAAIDTWLDSGKAPARSPDVLDLSLCHALEFLLMWLALPPDRQHHVVQNIARYEAEASAGETALRPRPRANKKTAR
jgi:hypothetical protein